MKIVLRWIIGILIVFGLAKGYEKLSQWSWKENLSPDHKPDVIDGIIGRTALDRYQEIKKNKDALNLPVYKSSVAMFVTQHGRYPHTMEELVNSGELSPDLARDQYGNAFEIRPQQKGILLRSAGPDKIKSSTDDLEFKISM